MACHSGRTAAALVLACTAGLVTGCGGDDGGSARPATGTRSPTVDPRPPTATATGSASATPTSDDDACAVAERRTVRNIWLWQAVRQVTGSPSGHSATAQDTVARHTAKAERRLLERCGGHVPPGFEQFVRDIRPHLAAARFGNPQLDGVLAAWLRWGSAAGAPEAARHEIRALESCRRDFFPSFDASYRVLWKWTDTGKAWWVDITFDNRTGKVLDGEMEGSATATKMLPDPFGWEEGPRPGPGRDAVLSWGGSSAETLELQSGITEQRAAPDIDQDVHTTADGMFRVVEMGVGLWPRGQRYWCSPPMHPMT